MRSAMVSVLEGSPMFRRIVVTTWLLAAFCGLSFRASLMAEPGKAEENAGDLKHDLAPAQAGESKETDPALSGAVRKLIKQLEAAELGRRDAAEAELIKLGPAALPLLPAESAIMNSGVKQALGAYARNWNSRWPNRLRSHRTSRFPARSA
ncbi:MAG: hypothetical protein QM811_01070 [Pirellulales bacterium]